MEPFVLEDLKRNRPLERPDEIRWNAYHWLKLNAKIWQRIVLLRQEKQPKRKLPHT